MHWILSLFMTLAYANSDELNSVLRAHQEAQQRELETYKQAHPQWQRFPNDEYVRFYTQHLQQGLERELRLWSEKCRQNCLQPKDHERMKAQVRVAVNLVQTQNELSKTRRPDQVSVLMRQAERQGAINLCAYHQHKCEQLGDFDKRAAELERKKEEELQVLRNRLTQISPDWENNKSNEQIRDALIALETATLEKELALNDELCGARPNDGLLCKSDAKKQQMRETAQAAVCRHQRVHLLHSAGKGSDERTLMSDHEAKWRALPLPRDCKSLLDNDRLAWLPVSTTPSTANPVVEALRAPAEETEQTDPQNYDADTCEWLNDLPRRIHAGPGCSREGNRLCVGYVVCKQKTSELRFIRSSTCSAEHCGPRKENAVACTKQRSYFSNKAPSAAEFVSPSVKRATASGTRQ